MQSVIRKTIELIGMLKNASWYVILRQLYLLPKSNKKYFYITLTRACARHTLRVLRVLRKKLGFLLKILRNRKANEDTLVGALTVVLERRVFTKLLDTSFLPVTQMTFFFQYEDSPTCFICDTATEVNICRKDRLVF